MRIVLDGRALGWSGVGPYSRELFDHLQRVDRENEYVVVVREEDRDLWQPSAANFRVVATRGLRRYGWREQLLLPLRLRRLRPDLVHFTTASVPVLYRGRHVTTVHDLTYVELGPGERGIRAQVRCAVFALVLRRAVHGSAALITPTEHVLGQLRRRYRRLPPIAEAIHEAAPLHALPGVVVEATGAGRGPAGLPPPPAPVVSALRTPHRPLASAAPDVAAPYLLYVGRFSPHKNVGALIDALPGVLEARPDLRLVLVGRHREHLDALRERAEALGVGDAVVALGEVSDATLAGLYARAALFVFPSLSEGFGLVTLEAMAHGLPIAASRASAIPEVCGDAAAYFDPRRPESIAAVIVRLLGDPAERERLSLAGHRRVEEFSWERAAARTLDVYRAAAAA